MKKFLLFSFIANIILSVIASLCLVNYLNISVNELYSTTHDLLVLLGVVVINIIFNFALYKALKVDIKKVYFLIPTIIFMICTCIGLAIFR